MDGSTAPFLVAPTQRMPRDAQFSPDERWIAYTADDSGTDEVYVVPFTGKAVAPDQFSNRTQVSTAGGSQPRWRANSRELYYVSPDNELMAVEIPPIPQTAGGDRMAASTPKRLFRLPALLLASAVHQYAATANGDRFLVAKATNSTMRLPIHVILNWTALLNKPKR